MNIEFEFPPVISACVRYSMQNIEISFSIFLQNLQNQAIAMFIQAEFALKIRTTYIYFICSSSNKMLGT